MTNVSRYPVFAQTDKDKLPPMQNEPNQAEIDAESARRLREAAQERRDQQQKKQFVTVVPDGQVYRWQRSDGRTLRTSSEAFTTLATAIQTAIVIAQCYGVPALVPAAG